MDRVEFGLDTFGDVTRGAAGAPLSHARVIRDVIAQGELADAVGVDVFGIGEHHRADFAISAPETVLAALAAKTRRIRLASAVTVLSSDDPIRVYQRFSTINAISSGRAEVILGRGSFTESFPLFGFPLNQYEALFEEKLDLFAALLPGGPVSWSGKLRAPLEGQRVYPEIGNGRLAAWIGVGGSPESVVRAARHDLPLMLAVIGGEPARFRHFVDLSRRAYEHFGRPARQIGVHSPGYVAATDEAAREEFFADYKVMRDHIGADRGWPPMSRAEFDREVSSGALHVGSPETVARKIAATVRALGASRFHLKYSAGPLPHERLMTCIGLYGEKVAPMVRDMLASDQAR